MRCIIGQAHREAILKHLDSGARMLEWGSGGSTVWFADRLPDAAQLTSVEHDRQWHETLSAAIGERSNVRLLLAEPANPLGRNATIDEENPAPLAAYLGAADGATYDVIVVDGVARGACLERARELLAPGGVVFLHDAQRDWYDAGKAGLIEHGTIGSCEEYPSPILWWGGVAPEPARYSRAALPLVISYYTEATPYEQEVEGLRQSCERLGLEHFIKGLPSRGSWEANCAHKARFVYDTYLWCDRPVLWVDADAVIRRPPMLVAGAEPDFAVQRAGGWQFASGTVYFNRTILAQRLIEQWLELCEQRPEIWDQIHLDTAWEIVTARHPLRTMWLPQTYAKIFDMAEDARLGNAEPVIEHYQASRRLKQAMSAEPRQMLEPDAALMAARRACRPRRVWYDQRFVLVDDDPPPAAWGVYAEVPNPVTAAKAR
ncbi:MAG: class I SAM-dependent methyltransferase [Planctomycetota bacterium]|nr:MAG: class I SAM-dependent methyltransferase [Planctomycetota bacterium]